LSYADLKIELGEELHAVPCACCQATHKGAMGEIYKNGKFYAFYAATLMIGHSDTTVNLTLSVGNWEDEDAKDERQWVLIQIFPMLPAVSMNFDDPNQPDIDPMKTLGTRLSRAAAMVSPMRAEFFRLADFIVDHDPAVRGYLISGQIGDNALFTSKN